MAAGWEGHRRRVWDASQAVGEWLVDALDPQPGETSSSSLPEWATPASQQPAGSARREG